MWLYELICEIQTKVANRSDMEEIRLYLEILILAVIEFSGYDIFMPEYDAEQAIVLFPCSFASLMQSDIWSVCTSQVIINTTIKNSPKLIFNLLILHLITSSNTIYENKKVYNLTLSKGRG